MQSLDNLQSLTPLQRAIYETDQLDLSLRESIRIVTARMGFFVGQNKYLEERAKINRLLGEAQ
ncbi:MAG TPA: hypothetical protein VGK33_13225 [Chloroflexota bacterium]|jgi:hypothetical protein